MRGLVIFAVLLAGLLFLVEPCMLVCATSISSGLVPLGPAPWYALSLIALFVVLDSRAGFVLLIPSIVSAAMAPEAAFSILIASFVLFARRYVEWMPFVLIAASILLVVFSGFWLAVFVMLALLIPILSDIPTSVWRIRAVALWFVLAVLALFFAARFVGSFDFPLIGFSLDPIAPVVFVAFAIQAVLLLGRDEHAWLLRSLVLFVGSLVFAELAFFAMPVVLAVLAWRIWVSIGEETLRGVRLVVVILVLVVIVPPLFAEPSDPLAVEERALIFAPHAFGAICDGSGYPDRIRPGTLDALASMSTFEAIGSLRDEGVSSVVYPEGFAEPIATVLRFDDDVGIEERDGLIVASLS